MAARLSRTFGFMRCGWVEILDVNQRYGKDKERRFNIPTSKKKRILMRTGAVLANALEKLK